MPKETISKKAWTLFYFNPDTKGAARVMQPTEEWGDFPICILKNSVQALP